MAPWGERERERERERDRQTDRQTDRQGEGERDNTRAAVGQPVVVLKTTNFVHVTGLHHLSRSHARTERKKSDKSRDLLVSI